MTQVEIKEAYAHKHGYMNWTHFVNNNLREECVSDFDIFLQEYSESYHLDKAKYAGFWGRTFSRQSNKIDELTKIISDLNAQISRLGAENEKLLKEVGRLNDKLISYRYWFG